MALPLAKVQAVLLSAKFDGWLFYDFRRSNSLASDFLGILNDKLLTRRFFYWIPAKGEPLKIVHAIEAEALDHLPGKAETYSTWFQLEACLQRVLKDANLVAMEYSPRNAIPYISKVDGGTLELVRSFGVEVVSSADLLQECTSVWDENKLQTHLQAAHVVDRAAESAWHFIRVNLDAGKVITEYDVQQFLMDDFRKNRCVTDCPPICAVNQNSANPHYMPTQTSHAMIKFGDFILLDLWCKLDQPNAAYADITRVGIAAAYPEAEQQKVFEVVRQARDTATEFVRACSAASKQLMGWEVDAVCRKVIEDAGYGAYFIHRTGHNIDVNTHGDGANIDNYETQDRRRLLPGTCFSIEPGVYLPGKFGVRLEYDIYIHHDQSVRVTGGEQKAIVCLTT